jgi:hypothetical protein
LNDGSLSLILCSPFIVYHIDDGIMDVMGAKTSIKRRKRSTDLSKQCVSVTYVLGSSDCLERQRAVPCGARAANFGTILTGSI